MLWTPQVTVRSQRYILKKFRSVSRSDKWPFFLPLSTYKFFLSIGCPDIATQKSTLLKLKNKTTMKTKQLQDYEAANSCTQSEYSFFSKIWPDNYSLLGQGRAKPEGTNWNKKCV